MKSDEDLVAEVIEGAVDGGMGVAVLLRKCRLLSHSLQNDSLKEWVLKELNGYDNWKKLPNYRIIRVGAKGFFIGPFQSQLNNQPLASFILKKEHRVFAEKAFLSEPASAYENLKDEGGEGYRIEWPGNLVALYQSSFFDGYALNRAWQDIPVHSMKIVPETVKNRILEFMLSINKEFGNKIGEKRLEVSNFIDSTIGDILKS